MAAPPIVPQLGLKLFTSKVKWSAWPFGLLGTLLGELRGELKNSECFVWLTMERGEGVLLQEEDV